MILLLLLPNFKLLDLTLIKWRKLCKSGKRKKGEKGMKVKTFLQVSGILRL